MPRNDPAVSQPYDLLREPIGPDERDSVDTDAVIRFIRKRRRLCLGWLVAGLCAGILYGTVTPAHYTASANILLEDNVAKSPDTPVGETDAAHSTFVETQVQVLESDEVVGRIVDEQQLAGDGEFGGMGGGLRALLVKYVRSLLGSGSAIPKREPRYATIERVRRGLSVRRVGVSDVVEIQFTSRDADRSATIANAVIKGYIDSRLALQRSAREETASHLRALLAELRDKAFPVDPPQDGIASVPQSGSEARAHFREQQERTEAYQALYGRLLRQALGDAGGDFAAANVRVITPAEPPLLAGSWVVVVVAFTAFGGAIGTGHALLREMTDHRLRTIEDIRISTGVDGAIGIPRVKKGGWRVDGEFPAYLQPAYTTVSGPIYDIISKIAVRLQDGVNRRSGWIIGIAASNEGTGVSSIAAHLARVIVESGQKTLLLDANWRKPSSGQILLNSSQSRKLARGLATVHLEAETFDILVLRATTPISELSASLSIVSTLDLLRSEYDCIIVDFNASEQTVDFEVGMTIADQVIAVAEARRTTSDSLCELLRKLPSDRIASIILNKI